MPHCQPATGSRPRTAGCPRRCGRASPRVRGSLAHAALGAPKAGSIPAGAGEPKRRARQASGSKVDPRGCGEPPLPFRNGIALRVDPRGCGGARPRLRRIAAIAGRSPRVRGSLRSPAAAQLAEGSIPAGAGEPGSTGAGAANGRVDPRGCGGARHHPASPDLRPGRSPRMRGSLGVLPPLEGVDGSIPADAGEPFRSSPNAVSDRVDPRGCGGACDLRRDAR